MEKVPVRTPNRTPFIVIDGMDGSGKGTQIDLLVDRAIRTGRKFYNTREPGGAVLSEEIRALFSSPEGANASARTQFLLMWAARSNWLEKIVIHNLSTGVPVISDRGDSSTLAYQVYAKEAPELEDNFWRMRDMIFGEHTPTLYIFVDVPASEAKRRVDLDSSRTKSAFDAQPLEWYVRVRHGFEEFRDQLPNHVLMVNGDRPAEVIHEEVYRIVSEHCGWK